MRAKSRIYCSQMVWWLSDYIPALWSDYYNMYHKVDKYLWPSCLSHEKVGFSNRNRKIKHLGYYSWKKHNLKSPQDPLVAEELDFLFIQHKSAKKSGNLIISNFMKTGQTPSHQEEGVIWSKAPGQPLMDPVERSFCQLLLCSSKRRRMTFDENNTLYIFTSFETEVEGHFI